MTTQTDNPSRPMIDDDGTAYACSGDVCGYKGATYCQNCGEGPVDLTAVLTVALTEMDAMTWLGCRHGDRESDEKIGQAALASRLAAAIEAAFGR